MSDLESIEAKCEEHGEVHSGAMDGLYPCCVLALAEVWLGGFPEIPDDWGDALYVWKEAGSGGVDEDALRFVLALQRAKDEGRQLPEWLAL